MSTNENGQFLDGTDNGKEISEHLDTCYANTRPKPTTGRWGGKKMLVEGRRRLEVDQRKRWCSALAKGVLDGFAVPLVGGRMTGQELAVLLGLGRRVSLHALDVLSCCAFAMLDGASGIWATHEQLGKATSKTKATTRRAVSELVAYELLELVTGTYDQHGAASSRTGNAYRVEDWVLGRIATCSNFEQASGTVSVSDRAGRSPGPVLQKQSRPEEMPAHAPSLRLVPLPAPEAAAAPRVSRSPSGTVYFRTPEEVAAAVQPCPVARQAETRTAPPEAPDGDGLGDQWAAWRELAAAGPHAEFMGELFADLERDAKLRAAGLEDPHERARLYEQRRRMTRIYEGGDL